MIICKTRDEIGRLRRSGQFVQSHLEELRSLIRPGVTTLDLEKHVEKRFALAGVKPAFKGYRGYPCCLCTSVNEEVVHGIPSVHRVLRNGDIISLDLGVIIEGFYGDSAVTVPVGEISPELQHLLRVTQDSLELAIAKVRLGNHLGDVSVAVQEHVEKNGFSVVREFVGHGIGRELHEEPQIPNYGRAGHGPLLKEGMVLAIEPMVNVGGAAIRVLDDNWTAVAKDGSYSAHFEHMVAVTSNGPEVLTRP